MDRLPRWAQHNHKSPCRREPEGHLTIEATEVQHEKDMLALKMRGP
jgi:hypothetical protein